VFSLGLWSRGLVRFGSDCAWAMVGAVGWNSSQGNILAFDLSSVVLGLGLEGGERGQFFILL
jgi:hypothetical protein